MDIQSELYSLARITQEWPARHFNVPLYQRLYVWGGDQVRTLLADLQRAFERNEPVFFLGNTLLVEQQDGEGGYFDLIDGQQRFTTLWLICSAWRRELEPFLKVSGALREGLRLRFAIRPEVNQYLESLAFGPPLTSLNEQFLGPMPAALELIKEVFESRGSAVDAESDDTRLQNFTRYVFHQVQFVITTVPRETDLNKLFEVINNRGIQLQHHEILKARMLNALTREDASSYAILWDACADMENFVENSLAGVSKLSKREIADLHWRDSLVNAAALVDALRKSAAAASDEDGMTLQKIFGAWDEPNGAELKTGSGDAEAGAEDAVTSWVRSIFGFPLFLQHTLRIWLLEHGQPDLPGLSDRHLLTLFEEHFLNLSSADEAGQNVRTFIELLWRLRVLFDQHVIKWTKVGDGGEIHLIRRISIPEDSKNATSLSRGRAADSDRGFSLLQSMLYHSQDITTQYWVTPLLSFMHQHATHPKKPEPFFNYLRHLDNHLLGSSERGSLAERTLKFMKDPWRRNEPVHAGELVKALGVHFHRYWFYKLEFVLWFMQRKELDTFDNFRITARNSVEHISSQAATDVENERVHTALHDFGNLALVSRSLNSEFSNRPFKVKQQQFLEKCRDRIDSLKMKIIYQHGIWRDEEALKHRDDMIEVMDSYYAATPGEPGAC